MCLSHLIYAVRPCLIHTYHVMSMPCSDHAVLLKATAQLGRRETAELCRGLEKNSMVRAWHGHDMTNVNQTRPHCVNQMAKAHSKPLAARHGRGTACARHAICVNPSLLLSSKKGISPLATQISLLELSLLKAFWPRCVEGEPHGRFAYVCHIATDIWIFSRHFTVSLYLFRDFVQPCFF